MNIYVVKMHYSVQDMERDSYEMTEFLLYIMFFTKPLDFFAFVY